MPLFFLLQHLPSQKKKGNISAFTIAQTPLKQTRFLQPYSFPATHFCSFTQFLAIPTTCTPSTGVRGGSMMSPPKPSLDSTTARPKLHGSNQTTEPAPCTSTSTVYLIGHRITRLSGNAGGGSGSACLTLVCTI